MRYESADLLTLGVPYRLQLTLSMVIYPFSMLILVVNDLSNVHAKGNSDFRDDAAVII